jgi:hypothetical protein
MPQHAALITVLLLERPTCFDCAASKSGLTLAEVDHYLTIIGTSLEVLRWENERCRVCGNVGPVCSIQRSSDLTRPGSTRASNAGEDDLWARVRVLVNLHEVPAINARENVEAKPCGLLCGRPFVRGRYWYEVRFSTRSFWLDRDCFAIWEEEMRSAKEQSA